MHLRKPLNRPQLHKRVGIFVFAFATALAILEYDYFFSLRQMSATEAFWQPSVFSVFFIGILFLLTAFMMHWIACFLQVILIIIPAYYAALFSTSGDLTSAIILLTGYVLALEYGFLTKWFHTKTIVIAGLYFVILFLGVNSNEDSTLVSALHSVLGTGLIVSIVYLVVQNQIVKDRMRAEKLEVKVTEQTRDLQKALKQKETLLREVHHRTKNNMQLISSLINLEYSEAEDENARMSADISMRRIQSLAIAHEYLHQSENIQNINLKDYVEGFLSVLASDFISSNIKISSSIDTGIITNIDGAIPLGLIINELVTNSYKYAFNVRQNAEITINIHQLHREVFVLVEDNGSGMSEIDNIEDSDKLGLQIVVRLIKQINGYYTTYQNNGTSWRITIPLDENNKEAIDRPVFFVDKNQGGL
jgi:two-component sensor histidine kinase